MQPNEADDVESVIHTWKIPAETEAATILRYVFKAEGRILGNGSDNRFLIRVNHASTNYRSVAQCIGDAGEFAEWDWTGFYVGRTGWSANADFGIECTINVHPDLRRTAYGRATFSHYDPSSRLLGWVSNGFWKSSAAIETVDLIRIGSGSIDKFSSSRFEEKSA